MSVSSSGGIVAQAISQLQSGIQETEAPSEGVVSDGEESDGTVYADRPEEVDQETQVETTVPGEEKDSSPEEQLAAATEDKTSTPSQKLKVAITDENGRRHIEIDPSDTEKLTKYVQMAHGARKWQAERDKLAKSQQELEQKFGSLNDTWTKFEKAWSEKGMAGLVDLLEGKAGAYDEHIKQQIERAEFMKKASPEAKAAFEAQEQLARLKAEIDRDRRAREDASKKAEQDREAMEIAATEAQLHPVFEKYRFAGRLGDETVEQGLDQMVWDTAMKRLSEAEEKGVRVTRELMDKEFREVANSFRKMVNTQATKKATKVVETAKKDATASAQASVVSKAAPKQSKEELINQPGGLRALLAGMKTMGRK